MQCYESLQPRRFEEVDELVTDLAISSYLGFGSLKNGVRYHIPGFLAFLILAQLPRLDGIDLSFTEEHNHFPGLLAHMNMYVNLPCNDHFSRLTRLRNTGPDGEGRAKLQLACIAMPMMLSCNRYKYSS